MLRVALGLLLVLACSGCAATESETAAAPGCKTALANPSAPDDQDCANQNDGQMDVHVSGVVEYGVAAGVR
jgi:hypothetical protein